MKTLTGALGPFGRASNSFGVARTNSDAWFGGRIGSPAPTYLNCEKKKQSKRKNKQNKQKQNKPALATERQRLWAFRQA